MVQIKALYYRYQHQIGFSIILIIVGISLLIWWQVSQSSDGVSSKDFTTIAAHQKNAKKSEKIKKTINNEKSANIVIDVKEQFIDQAFIILTSSQLWRRY